MKRSISLRTGALLLSLCLLLPPAASAADAGRTLLHTTRRLTDTLTWHNTVSEHTLLGREESHTLELVPGGGVYPITVQGDVTVYGTGTIDWAAAQARALGYNVLAGVNSDFYSPQTGVPLGIAIENGIYKSSPEGGENALAFTGGAASLVQQPEVSIQLENTVTGQLTQLTHFNKNRYNGGGLYLFNSDFSKVSSRATGEGWVVKLSVLEGEMTVSGRMELQVAEVFQLDGAWPMEAGYLYLSADATSNLDNVYHSFQAGDTVTLTTQCSDPALAGAQWACGCGDILVQDGAVTDSSAWGMSAIGSAPRTALGVRPDGTMVFYTVDGRRVGHSLGLSLADLAQEMLAQGCLWAVNLDGGGSTCISVRTPGAAESAVVNSPSDGRMRSCSCYILLVSDDLGSGSPSALALENDGAAVLAGTEMELGRVLACDSGLNSLELDMPDLTIRSLDGLGWVEDGVYYAGDTPGTDTLLLSSRSLGLSGTAQVHVVPHLTQLDITRDGAVILDSLNLFVDSQTQLGVDGLYWGRTALHDTTGAEYTLEGEIGQLTPDGLFTAGLEGGAGSITVTAGGLERTIPVTLRNIFRDVAEDHWSYEAVKYCYESNIVNGISSTEFGRAYPISRGDFVMMLYKALGCPATASPCTFSDVDPSDYYAEAIAWAQETQLASGVGDNRFGAKDNISRQDAFTIIGKLLPQLGLQPGTGDEQLLSLFQDEGLIAPYARPSIAALAEQSVINGNSGLLDPLGLMTREQMAAVLYQCSVVKAA